jgi:tetratricopeptide (TPR) repeat protein
MLDSAASGVDCRVRALQFYEADQLDSALALYTRATQYNRNDKYAWHGIAATLGRLGRYDEALPAYDEALRIDSNYVGAIWHRACGYANALQKDKALSDLRRAIALDSTVKQDAQQDKCFEWMWGDSVYLSVVR